MHDEFLARDPSTPFDQIQHSSRRHEQWRSGDFLVDLRFAFTLRSYLFLVKTNSADATARLNRYHCDSQWRPPLWEVNPEIRSLADLLFVDARASRWKPSISVPFERIDIMDRSGYDCVWLAEHHFNTYSVCPSVTLMGTHVARARNTCASARP
jgi:hypothetical protein